MMRTIRWLVEEVYYRSALAMPLRWQWQYNYCMRARFYLENCDQPEFSGWPWNWTMKFKDQ